MYYSRTYCNLVKQHYVEISILCDLAPPAVFPQKFQVTTQNILMMLFNTVIPPAHCSHIVHKQVMGAEWLRQRRHSPCYNRLDHPNDSKAVILKIRCYIMTLTLKMFHMCFTSS